MKSLVKNLVLYEPLLGEFYLIDVSKSLLEIKVITQLSYAAVINKSLTEYFLQKKIPLNKPFNLLPVLKDRMYSESIIITLN